MLFAGALRANLDPAGQQSDAELWAALDQVNLKAVVEALKDRLDHRFYVHIDISIITSMHVNREYKVFEAIWPVKFVYE